MPRRSPITHGHADHFGDTIAIAQRTGATVYAAFEITEYCGTQGVENVEPMNPGGQIKHGLRVRGDGPRVPFVVTGRPVHGYAVRGDRGDRRR